jgi:hypothetical protein
VETGRIRFAKSDPRGTDPSPGTGGIRLRGPMQLERLELRAGDLPFRVNTIYLNDCRIEQLILDGIATSSVTCWGDSQIGEIVKK